MSRYLLAVGALLVLALVLRIGFVASMPLAEPFWDEVAYHAWAESYAEVWRSLVGAESEPSAPTFKEAFRKTLQKGEAYSASVGLVYAVTGGSRRAVFILQALADTLSCLFVFLIARALAGRAAGIVALFLMAIYQPFFFTAGRLQTETLAMTLLLGGLWATVASPRCCATAWQISGGVMTALAMLTKPALKLLVPLYLLAIVLRHWREPRPALVRPLGFFLLGFGLLIGPRLVWTQVAYGSASLTGSISPGSHIYGGAVIENLGWKTDHMSFANPPRGELLEVLGDPPQRVADDADQFRAAKLTWLRHPAASTGVALHKLYVAWALPYNDARHEFLTARGTTGTIHRVVLILGLFGMPLALRKLASGLPLILVTLYLWATYLVAAIEVRYAVVAMPLMLCFAALALVGAYEGVVRGARWRPLAVSLVSPLLVLVLVWGVGGDKAKARREWRAPLSDRHSIRHEAVIPADLGAPGAGELRIDLLPADAAACDVVVRLNDGYRRVLEGGFKREHAAMVPAHAEFARAQGRDREPARSWYRFGIPPALLIPGQPLRVELGVEGGGPAECLALFGDDPEDAAFFDGPSVFSPERMADTSGYRYMHTGDFRMRRRTPLVGSARSSFFDGESWSDADLSPATGTQSGRYRIFLVLGYPERVAVL